MGSPTVILNLRDAALGQQVARWLDDESIAYRLRTMATTIEPSCEPDAASVIVLTDAATLSECRPGAAFDEAGPVGPGTHALIVVGSGTSWEERALARAQGAVQYLSLPASRPALMAALHAAGDARRPQAAAVLLFGPSGAAAPLAAGELAGGGVQAHVLSDPQHLFARLQASRPDVLVLLPGLAGAAPHEVLRMVRSDPAFDDLMLLTVVDDAAMASALPSGASALLAPLEPGALARAVLDRARRRRALAAWRQPTPLLALQDQERRALDAHALVSIADQHGDIVYANDHFCSTSGYRRDELLGRNHRIVKSGRHSADHYAGLWRTIAGGAIWQGELCNRRKDGSLYWVMTTIMPMGDPRSGTRRYLSIRTDISATKSVQLDLRRRVREQRVLETVRRQLVNCDRTMLLRVAPKVLRLAGRLVGCRRILWTASPAAGLGQTVARWSVTGRGDQADADATTATLRTPAGPAESAAGMLHWWFSPGDAPPGGSGLAFAHAMAGLLGSAWRRTTAELSQRASELALADMLRAFPGIAAAVTEDGVYEFANEMLARHLGRVPGDIVGRRLEDLLGADGLADIRRRQDRIVAGSGPLAYEHSLPVQGEAEPRWFSSVHFSSGGQPGIPRRFFQIGIDVTERRRMAGLLETLLQTTQSEARLQRLLATMALDLGAAAASSLKAQLNSVLRDAGQFFDVDCAHLVRLADDTARFELTNEWCADGVGSMRDTLEAHAVGDLPWLGHQLLDGQAPILIGDVHALPLEARAEQALLLRLGLRSVLAVPVVADGRTIGFMGFGALRRCPDWSDSAMQALLTLGQIVAGALHRARTEHALLALKERAEAASAAKSEFLASMSHELRTPMNAVLGFGQLLEMSLRQQPRELGFVQEILKGGRHLLTLIDDVLDLARIESGRLELSPEPIALGPVADECLRLMQPLAQRRAIGITSDMGDLAVQADRVRLKQVLVNLLSNAIKYNVDGGRVAMRALETLEGRIRVEVQDTGQGIAADRQPELFQPFNRLGAETAAIEGTGIGLALVRRLVGMMHGHVGVASALGQGSTFWFELPTPPAGGDAGRPPASASTFGGLQATFDKRVLYIDDNPPNLRLMESILARWPGVTLLTAQHPQLGLELAQAHRPDIVLLDIQMAPLDGFEVLRHLRRQPDLARLPVVAITANAMPRDVARVKAAGFDECLTKPFDVHALLAVLDRFLHPPDDARQPLR